MSCFGCFCDWMSVVFEIGCLVPGVFVIGCLLFWVFLGSDVCSGCFCGWTSLVLGYYDWISVVGVTVTGCLLFRVLQVCIRNQPWCSVGPSSICTVT